MQTRHVPVMLAEVVTFLRPRPGGHYIDGTLGGGGHTEALLEQSAPAGRVLGIDADAQALARVGERLSAYVQSGRLVLAHGNFVDLAAIAGEAGFLAIQGVVLDLGFSSHQMDDPQRGFSFGADGPLDMRLDQAQETSAADIVNTASEQELADIFWRYGEERYSRQVARRIVRERERGPITRTAQLASLVAGTVAAGSRGRGGHRPGAIHPATRVFQGLRIAVNHELEHLEAALPRIVDVLSQVDSGGGDSSSEGAGRMVMIAFHSLEDRIVKEFMRREATDCLCPPRVPVCVCGHKARLRILTPRPLTPTAQEIATNPRARSAKLRAAEIVVSS
ncbi:MAG: 16S rRNA (cytosine(1402)-N(4))-methyltransferase RsmH [Ktedonobacteraceae bacterium]|nr:16S rRNA (cytosine(1402)-N(4))-methyltransferase RsmH [Ktedonobacteraceae bacterium]